MTNTASGEIEVARRSLAARTAMLVFLIVATSVFAALGVWQVKRLFWKIDLIARVDARVSAAPMPPPASERWSHISATDDEYTRVVISGRFLNDKEAHVVASTERGPGYWVLTPLRQADGTIVMINRGFVTNERRDPVTRAAGQIAGETSVTGLLRISEENSWILRKNDSAADRWYRRVPAEIADARSLSGVAPYFIDADRTSNAGGWPVGGLTIVQFSNSHLVYAVTWFGLALLAAASALFVVRSEFGQRTGSA
jgi:surfeit locus 1 family protein